MAFDLQIQRADPTHLQIERHFLRQIQRGTLKPGQRLPPNMALAQKWGVSCTAVQKAFANLTGAGLLARAPRRGTYVRAATDKAIIGLLFGPSLSDETAHFYRAILKALRQEIDLRDWTCRAYDGLSERSGRDRTQRVQVHKQLTSDLHNHAFRGLVEFAPDTKWPGDLEARAPLPSVLWNPTQRDTDFKMDNYQFARESVRFLVGGKRRRIAYLRTTWHLAAHADDLDGFLDEVRAQKLPGPQIEQIVRTTSGQQHEHEIHEMTTQLVRRWKSGRPGREMPDALLVNDDIAMRAMALALIQSGVRVPEQVKVICLSTQGVNLHYGIPVVRYEFSSRELARQLLELLWKRIRKESLPPLPIVLRGHLKE